MFYSRVWSSFPAWSYLTITRFDGRVPWSSGYGCMWCLFEKMKISEKRPGMVHFKRQQHAIRSSNSTTARKWRFISRRSTERQIGKRLYAKRLNQTLPNTLNNFFSLFHGNLKRLESIFLIQKYCLKMTDYERIRTVGLSCQKQVHCQLCHSISVSSRAVSVLSFEPDECSVYSVKIVTNIQ